MAKAKASKTANESRAAKLAKGYAQKAFLLPPAAIKALDRIAARDGVTDTEAVARAIEAYASETNEISNAELVRLVSRRLGRS